MPWGPSSYWSVRSGSSHSSDTREWSPNVIRRLEEAVGIEVVAPGFPAEMVDDEPEEPGHEVLVHRG